MSRNSKGLFLYKRLPDEEIEHSNDAVEIIFSFFKPQYKVMKEFQILEGVQTHFNLFTLRHNFRLFLGKSERGFPPVQLEGLNVSLNEWPDLLYSGDKAIAEEILFLSRRAKEAIFSKGDCSIFGG